MEEVGKLLSALEVHERYGLPLQLLKDSRDRGTGGPPYFKINYNVFYKAADVEHWLSGHRVEVGVGRIGEVLERRRRTCERKRPQPKKTQTA